MARTFTGMGGHHARRPETTIWLTPPEVITALGGADSFDLDPCAPFRSPIRTARRVYSWVFQDGLAQPWAGRCFLNPPYDDLGPWLARLARHGTGTALIFARTDTDAFHRWVWESGTAALFIRRRLNFHYPNGDRAKKNSGAPSVLVAYGRHDTDMLAQSGVPGSFQLLNLPRGLLVAALAPTWREAVTELVRSWTGPVSLGELYQAMATHPKARRNPNWRAKIRQTLQTGPFQRVDRGVWRAA